MKFKVGDKVRAKVYGEVVMTEMVLVLKNIKEIVFGI